MKVLAMSVGGLSVFEASSSVVACEDDKKRNVGLSAASGSLVEV